MEQLAIRDKWVNYLDLKGTPKMEKYLPVTLRMTEEAFWRLLDTYHTVMLKPCVGHSGYGVIQVRAIAEGRYEIHAENLITTIEGRQQTYNALLMRLLPRAYIVQRRIPLATINKQPFDLRVMTQRKRNKPWTVTGMFAKVADKGYIITNVTRSILPVTTSIRKSSIPLRNQQELSSLIRNIRNVSIRAAQRFGTIYPAQRIVGLDIGLDNQGRIQIIEANFKPHISPFRMLKDKSMYRRILEYKK